MAMCNPRVDEYRTLATSRFRRDGTWSGHLWLVFARETGGRRSCSTSFFSQAAERRRDVIGASL
jgi:hypothetical protein